MTINYRRLQIVLAFFSLLVFGGSLYFQYVKGLEPCPLCLMQRLCAFLLFMIFFSGVAIRTVKGATKLVYLQCLVAGSGLFFACRQLWLQSLPADQVPACMPGLDTLIHYFPWQDVLRTLLWGTGECAKISWQWFGLSMPTWSALFFAFFLLATMPVWVILRRQRATLYHE